MDRSYEVTAEGMDIHRVGGVEFDVYDIRVPEDVFYRMEQKDGLLDLFTYAILGREETVAGRVLMFNVGKRLDSLPPQIRETWESYMTNAYAVLLQTIPENEWFSLAGCETLTDARHAFGEWFSKFGPGHPIRVPRGKQDETTIWNSGLPGIRTIGTFGPITPFSYLTCQN